jgi:hypothetical protein
MSISYFVAIAGTTTAICWLLQQVVPGLREHPAIAGVISGLFGWLLAVALTLAEGW